MTSIMIETRIPEIPEKNTLEGLRVWEEGYSVSQSVIGKKRAFRVVGRAEGRFFSGLKILSINIPRLVKENDVTVTAQQQGR